MKRTILFPALTVLGGVLALLAASCAGERCLIEQGCTFSCETDDDCDRSELAGTVPLCRPDPFDPTSGQRICTRTCTDSEGCLCVCAKSPDEGVCDLLDISSASSHIPSDRTEVCRSDKPSIAVMCEAVEEELSGCCQITKSEVDACATYEQSYPACTAQLDALFFCAYRLDSICVGAGVYAGCAAEATALEQCTGILWNGLNHEVCMVP